MFRTTFVAALAGFAALCATPAMGDVGKPQGSGAAAAAASQPTKSGYIEANGLSYYYQVHGKGEPLLLLHGGLGQIEMFGPVLGMLAKQREVSAVRPWP